MIRSAGQSRSSLVLLAALVAGGVLACSKPREASRPAEESARSVQVVRAQLRPMERSVPTTGSLAAHEETTVSVKVAGRLRALNVDLGSSVKQGEIMAQVEPRDYELRLQQSQAALAQSRAAVGLALDGTDDTVAIEDISSVRQALALLDEATKNRERVLRLSKEGVSSTSELDTMEFSYRVALNRHGAALDEARTRQAALAQRRAELELARQQLSDTSVRAPFDGAVQMRLANLGDFLTAGAPVVKVVKPDPLRLRLQIPEREAQLVRTGQQVRFTVEGDTNTFSGALSRISPAVEELSRMLLIEADIPSRLPLRPGLFARARIQINPAEESLAVPASAIKVFAGIEKVVLAIEGKAQERPVSTGRRDSGWVEILSGLAPGDLVVLSPGGLRTGQALVVSEQPGPLRTTRTGDLSGR